MHTITAIRACALAGQFAFLVSSLMPGVPQPAKGAMLLASFWCLGTNLGASLYGRKKGGDR